MNPNRRVEWRLAATLLGGLPEGFEASTNGLNLVVLLTQDFVQHQNNSTRAVGMVMFLTSP
jgi:hypothetical protein